jgi:hypothetical protein
MTVSVATSKVIFAPGAPTTGPFTFSFEIYEGADLRVIKRSTLGVDTVLTLNTDYTVSAGPWPSGGNVTTTANVVSGEKLLIKLSLAATQGKDLPTNGIFPAADVEQALDRNTKIAQQYIETISRCVQLSETSVLSAVAGADPAAGNLLTWDGSAFGWTAAASLSPALVTISAFMQTLLDDTSAASAQVTLGVQAANLLARGIVGGRLSVNSWAARFSYAYKAASNSVVYYAPYTGHLIGLYASGAWKLSTINTLGLSITALTDNRPFDIFAFDNAGTVSLEGVSWTSDTVRATALSNQDSILVKSGDATRRYLGTARKRAGLVNMVDGRLELWNMYNRIPVSTFITDLSNTWSIVASSAWRQARASAANQVDFVVGVEDGVDIKGSAYSRAINSTATLRLVATGIGIDSTVFNSGTLQTGAGCTSTMDGRPVAHINESQIGLAIGQHFAAWLERGDGTDTQTFYGDNYLTADNISCGMSLTLIM